MEEKYLIEWKEILIPILEFKQKTQHTENFQKPYGRCEKILEICEKVRLTKYNNSEVLLNITYHLIRG